MSNSSTGKRSEKDNAREFVESIFESEDGEQRQKLLEKLDHSTVALRMAVVYIKKKNENSSGGDQKYAISDYLRACDARKGDLSNLGPSLKDEPKVRAIFLALQLSLDAIGKEEKGPEAIGVCHLLALFAPERPIPVKLLKSLMTAKPLDIVGTLKLLMTYAIGCFKAADETFRVDNPVQKALKASFGASEMTTLDKSLELITRRAMDPEFVYHYISIWDCASNYGVLVRKYHKDIVGQVMNLLNRHVRDNNQTANFGMAQIEVMERHLGRNNMELLKLKSNLSILIEHTGVCGGIQEARRLFKESSEVLKNNDPDAKCVHLIVRFNDSMDLVKAGRLKDALKKFLVIYEECKQVPGVEKDIILQTRGYIALLKYELGSKESTKEAYIKEMKTVVEEMGSTHEHTAECILSFMSEVAQILIKEGRRDEAMKIQSEMMIHYFWRL